MTGLPRRALLGAGLALSLHPGPVAAQAGPARRVVALDWSIAQTLIAIGVAPLAVPDPEDYRVWAVEPPLPAGILDVGSYAQPNLELLAALAPDLIVTMQLQDPVLPLLRGIAPVLRLPIFTPDRDPWARATAATRALGARTDRAGAAEALIAGVDARAQAARAALAARAVPPILLASFVDARHVRVYGAGSLPRAVLDRLGLPAAWPESTGIPTDVWGGATLGIEALAGLHDALLLAFEPLPPDLLAARDASPLWQALPFVRAGRVATLPAVAMYGALPAADRLVAALASAVRRLG